MKYSPELFEKLVIALNRSMALLMELNNLILEDGYKIDELHKFIESNLELLKRLNGMSKSKKIKSNRQKIDNHKRISRHCRKKRK